jgi:hypothetical protein
MFLSISLSAGFLSKRCCRRLQATLISVEVSVSDTSDKKNSLHYCTLEVLQSTLGEFA